MKVFGRICLIVTCICLGSTLSSQTIKLGSTGPKDSHWDVGLKKLASDWYALSNGDINLRIYPGGIIGDELDIIRKMRIGQIDAAAISALGLNTIYSGITSVTLPFLFQTDDEFRYVLDKMKPFLNAEIEKKGYKVILWTSIGWVYFFGRTPIETPEDLKKMKLFVTEGDSLKINLWKDSGFNVIPLGFNDILASLQSGMIDALAVPPLAAAAYQWFAVASNMMDFRWAPLFGAVIMRTKTWQKISSDIRPILLEAAHKTEEWMWAETVQTEQRALEIMLEYGLTIHPVSSVIRQRWVTLLNSGFDRLLGESFDKEPFEMAIGFLEDHRQRNSR